MEGISYYVTIGAAVGVEPIVVLQDFRVEAYICGLDRLGLDGTATMMHVVL